MELVTYIDNEGRKPFSEWLLALADRDARRRILARLARVEAGNLERTRQIMTRPRHENFEETLLPLLADPKEAAEYLDAVMELEDPAALLMALRHVARAHGMAEMARQTNLGEKTLFRALSKSGNPTLNTITKVLHAAGLRLSVTPVHT